MGLGVGERKEGTTLYWSSLKFSGGRARALPQGSAHFFALIDTMALHQNPPSPARRRIADMRRRWEGRGGGSERRFGGH